MQRSVAVIGGASPSARSLQTLRSSYLQPAWTRGGLSLSVARTGDAPDGITYDASVPVKNGVTGLGTQRHGCLRRNRDGIVDRCRKAFSWSTR
jgi:hypothetical protein